MDLLAGKKTYIVALLMVAVAAINMASGEITLELFLQNPDLKTLLEGLGFMFLRSGVANAKGRTGTKP